ncbi:MAG: response regulator transcription factor [Candidatus Omnitrophota bacterium]
MRGRVIAIVDDEPDVVSTVSEYLGNKGFTMKGFSDSVGLFSFLDQELPDLILLDLMLPGMHGLDICKNLKQNQELSTIPVIMLTADNEECDKVSGLDIGADDYMVKPFSLNELNARIKAVLRRNNSDDLVEKKKIVVEGGRIIIDPQKYQVIVDSEIVEVTPTEFKILELLCSKKGQVFTRSRILDYLWGEEKVVIERTIDVHIRHLRKKVELLARLIKNIRGIGYKLEE